MRLTGIASFKNIVSLGYPAIEAALSIMPVVDEFLINDGGSDDDTWLYLEKLQVIYPGKVKLYSIPWGGQNCCKEFDASLNNLIWEAKGNWIIEAQGDELWHEEDISALRHLIEELHDGGHFNSIRHWCKSCSWTRIDSYHYYNVRIVKKLPGLISHEWGDCFHIRGQKSVREGFTSHNVPPEWFEGNKIKYYHVHRLFPLNKLAADYAMAHQNAAGDPPRPAYYEAAKRIDWTKIEPPKPEDVLDCLPALIKGLSQSRRYYVRNCLFDKAWLKSATGLDYA